MHPLSFPLSPPLDVSSAVSIPLPHSEHHTSAILTPSLLPIYAICTLKPYFASIYSLIILYVTRSFGLYATTLLAILSSGTFPSPSSNSTFTLITLSGFCGKVIPPSPHAQSRQIDPPHRP